MTPTISPNMPLATCPTSPAQPSASAELSVADLPFLFRDNDHARGAMDGALGKRLAAAIERECNYRILGWYENGFRHISNRLRPVCMPADLKDMHIRVLPSQVQKRTFELLGARPEIMDLTDAIRMIKAGEIDAQENPLTNTVTYGVHKFHRFHTISNHFYISRPIFLHRPAFDGWPADLKEAMQRAVTDSVAFQRDDMGSNIIRSRKPNLARRLQVASHCFPLDSQDGFLNDVGLGADRFAAMRQRVTSLMLVKKLSAELGFERCNSAADRRRTCFQVLRSLRQAA